MTTAITIQDPMTSSESSLPVNGRVFNYCVQDLATIQLIDAPQSMIDAIARELGKSWGTPLEHPDIRVSFIDQFSESDDLRFIGLHQAAFDTKNFYLLDENGRKIQIAFDKLGEPCELVCERGVARIPLLIPILALRLLRRGYVLLHSSAFVYNGTGILATGWQKGGKTEMLLPFMAAGADYLSDEWTIISSHDGTMRGLSSIVQVWSWHYRFLPRLWERVEPGVRYRIRLVRAYQHLYRSLPSAVRQRLRPRRFLHELSLEGGFSLLGQSRTAPAVLFGDHIWNGPAAIDRIFLPTVGIGDTRVLSIDPQEVAHRMTASLAVERRNLLTAYEQFRFAFSSKVNPLIENVRAEELRLLLRAFVGKPTYEVCHPYPVPLHKLYEITEPLCTRSGPPLSSGSKC